MTNAFSNTNVHALSAKHAQLEKTLVILVFNTMGMWTHKQHIAAI